MNRNQFYIKTGISNGFLDKGGNPSSDKLEKILETFPELNLYWIVTGKGDMLLQKSIPNIIPKVIPNYQKQEKYNNEIAAEPEMAYATLMPKVVTVDKNDNELIALVPHKAAAGYLNGYADAEFIENLPAFSLPGFTGQSHRAFEIRGQSMLPTHHSGSIAIGRSVENLGDIRDRRVYIIVTKSDGIVLKRILNRLSQEGKLILMSDNDNKTDYPNYPVDPEEILELWYWRASIIRESPEPGNIYHRLNNIEAKVTFHDQLLKNKGLLGNV